MTLAEESFSTVFTQALRGEPCVVVGLDGGPVALPMREWTGRADAGDHELLDLCQGATIDIGCGPGRLAAALVGRGHRTLGIDLVPEAVWQTRERGVTALRGSVFEPVPREGAWDSALLADGNIGIGGDPLALLTRVRELIDPRGRIVVELAPPGTGTHTGWARLESADARSKSFRWSVVGVDAIGALADAVGMRVASRHYLVDDRVAVVLIGQA